MSKIFAGAVAIFFAIMALSSPATADTDPPADNKKVTLCHATSSATNPYNKIEVSVAAFYNAGHIDHSNDIWEAFSYTTKGGDVVNVPSQGDTSLLAFEECERPDVDNQIAVPAVSSVDECGTSNDSVTPVRDDTKYTTNVGPRVGDSITVTFTALDGFVFQPGSGVSNDGKTATVTVNFPNNDDCDLPATGGDTGTNVLMGVGALILLGIVGAFTFLAGRRTSRV